MTTDPAAQSDALDDDLEAFLSADYPRVVAAVALITQDRPRAEDAVQDAIVKTLARPPRHEVRSMAAWITAVATNEAKMSHRRRNAETRALARAEADERVAGPDETVIDRVPVLTALADLSLQQRQICVMHYYLDASVATIAVELGVAEGTVKTQLHRARHALAPLLTPSEEDADGER